MKLMLNRKVVIVLPTYNEKENLPRMVQALFELEIPTLPS
jgi:glycosyltransferase involved in cell wall biosynthesis